MKVLGACWTALGSSLPASAEGSARLDSRAVLMGSSSLSLSCSLSPACRGLLAVLWALLHAVEHVQGGVMARAHSIMQQQPDCINRGAWQYGQCKLATKAHTQTCKGALSVVRIETSTSAPGSSPGSLLAALHSPVDGQVDDEQRVGDV